MVPTHWNSLTIQLKVYLRLYALLLIQVSTGPVSLYFVQHPPLYRQTLVAQPPPHVLTYVFEYGLSVVLGIKLSRLRDSVLLQIQHGFSFLPFLMLHPCPCLSTQASFFLYSQFLTVCCHLSGAGLLRLSARGCQSSTAGRWAGSSPGGGGLLFTRRLATCGVQLHVRLIQLVDVYRRVGSLDSWVCLQRSKVHAKARC